MVLGVRAPLHEKGEMPLLRENYPYLEFFCSVCGKKLRIEIKVKPLNASVALI